MEVNVSFRWMVLNDASNPIFFFTKNFRDNNMRYYAWYITYAVLIFGAMLCNAVSTCRFVHYDSCVGCPVAVCYIYLLGQESFYAANGCIPLCVLFALCIVSYFWFIFQFAIHVNSSVLLFAYMIITNCHH
jgi:hypothetical protein